MLQKHFMQKSTWFAAKKSRQLYHESLTLEEKNAKTKQRPARRKARKNKGTTQNLSSVKLPSLAKDLENGHKWAFSEKMDIASRQRP